MKITYREYICQQCGKVDPMSVFWKYPPSLTEENKMIRNVMIHYFCGKEVDGYIVERQPLLDSGSSKEKP